jgi:hypothetical protein
MRLETLDDGGAVTGSRQGEWSLFRHPDRPPEVRRVSISGPGLKRLRFPKDEALRDVLEGLPAFFSPQCEMRLVGFEGEWWKFRTWAAAGASPESPCFDGLVWVTPEGLAVRAEGRRAPAFRFYDGEEHRFPRGLYTMDTRGFPVRIEGEDVLMFQTVFDGRTNLRVRVRHLTLYSDYQTMHSSEPVIIEQGDVEGEP